MLGDAKAAGSRFTHTSHKTIQGSDILSIVVQFTHAFAITQPSGSRCPLSFTLISQNRKSKP